MKLKYTNIDVQRVIGFSIVFILTVLMSSVAWIQTRQMYQQVQVLYNHPLMVSRAIGELRFDILIVQREMRDLLLANNEKEISDALLTIGIYNDRASKQVLILKDLYLGDRKDIDIINNAMVDWNFKRTEIVKLVREGKTPKAKKGKHCSQCSLVEDCKPYWMLRHRPVKDYLTRMCSLEAEDFCGDC